MGDRRAGRALDALAGVLLLAGVGLTLWSQYTMREIGAGRDLYRAVRGGAAVASNLERVDRLRTFWYVGIALAVLGLAVGAWSYFRHFRNDGQANRP